MTHSPGRILRSLLFHLGLLFFTTIWASLSLTTAPLPYRRRYRIITLWTPIVLWWLALTCGIRVRVSGRENIPDRSTVIMAKHQSAWETLYLQLLFSPQVWVLKRELLWIPLFGWALALLKPIAIDRGAKRAAISTVLKQGRQRLSEGCHVVIFPEGTRVAPGEHRRYGAGGALLAAHTGSPIIPIAHNAGLFWPRRGLIKNPGTIDIVVGPAIESGGRKTEQLRQDTERWIEDTMLTLPMPQRP